MMDFSKYFKTCSKGEVLTFKGAVFSLSAYRDEDGGPLSDEVTIGEDADAKCVGLNASGYDEYVEWCNYLLTRPYSMFSYYRKDITGQVLRPDFVLGDKADEVGEFIVLRPNGYMQDAIKKVYVFPSARKAFNSVERLGNNYKARVVQVLNVDVRRLTNDEVGAIFGRGRSGKPVLSVM